MGAGAGAGAGPGDDARAAGGGPGFLATKSKRQTSQKRADESALGSPHDGHASLLVPAAAPPAAGGIGAPHTEQ
jgi:hypothetical protein